MFETWGAKKGIKIVKVPNSYGVYVEKMTASLTSNSDQYDVIWHNDDWGQLWAHLLEPTDDIDALKYAEKWGMDKVVFGNAQGQNTVVPMGQTFSVFFYRSDLVKPEEVPKTLAELVETSQEAAGRQQGEVRLCRRHGDEPQLVQLVLVDVGQQLRRAGAALRARQQEARGQRLEVDASTEPCMKETVEYWWDAINTHKISPRGMPAYDRNEANAIFMARRRRLHRRRLAVVGHLQRSGQVEDGRQDRAPRASRSDRTARSRSPGTTSGAGRSRSRSRPSARRSPRRCWAP